ncbi:MAG TPA: general stress protein, partial [Acetobacteraceae bacterium]|nr:general stress protein [Acetobacteraceae bacterium]
IRMIRVQLAAVLGAKHATFYFANFGMEIAAGRLLHVSHDALLFMSLSLATRLPRLGSQAAKATARPQARFFLKLSSKEASAMSETRTITNRGNFALDREKASRAGRVGGQKSSGNFAHNRVRAVEAGRKGGERSHGGGGAPNNPGNFAQDRERAAAAGRKGGLHSHTGPQDAP